MDRATLEEYLAKAEEYISSAVRMIERQTVVVARLKENGRPTKDAQELLERFERSCQSMRADRDLIQGLLRRADGMLN